MPKLWEAKSLSLRYGDRLVLDRISASMQQGDYLVLAGVNGAGKTSFVRALLGQLPLAGGELQVAPELRRRPLAYLPQERSNQSQFPVSAWEFVATGGLPAHGPLPCFSRRLRQKALDKLADFGLAEQAKQRYGSFSGGQRQRLRLARALMTDSPLLILDEAESGLDPEARRELCQHLRALHRSGLSVLHISHDPDMLEGLATALLFLQAGKAHYWSSIAAYKESPEAAYFYPTSPQAAAGWALQTREEH